MLGGSVANMGFVSLPEWIIELHLIIMLLVRMS